MRSPSSSRLALALLALPACAFDPGDPWGVLDLSAEAAFAPAAGRLDAQGRLLTSSSYAVALDTLTLEVRAVTVTVAPPTGRLSFDPATPPPGYSLCHSGHCHADDGRLVPYPEIEAELAGAASGAFTLTRPVEATVDLLAADAVPLPLPPCPAPDCDLPRGVASAVRVDLGTLTLTGRAFDASAAGRLPAEGAPLALTVPLDASLAAPLDAPLGADHPVGLALALRLSLTERLLDGLDLSAPLTPADVADRATDHSTLTPSTTRFDL